MDALQRLYLGFVFADGGHQLRRVLARELYDNSTFLLRIGLFVWGLPNIVQYFLDKILNSILTKVAFPFARCKYISKLFQQVDSRDSIPPPPAFHTTGTDNMSAYKETMDLMQDYHKKMDEFGLDAILLHAAMHPAPVKARCMQLLSLYKGLLHLTSAKFSDF